MADEIKETLLGGKGTDDLNPDGGSQGADDNLGGEDEGADTGADKGGEAKYTQDYINKAIESRLARERKKNSELIEEKAEALAKTKLADKQRISQLSDAEQEMERLTEREKAVKAREEESDYQDRFRDTESALRKRELSPEFAEFVIAKDEETTFNNVKKLQKLYEESVKASVKEALKGETPKVTGSTITAVTQEQFDGMGYVEKLELKRKDVELYNKLKK